MVEKHIWDWDKPQKNKNTWEKHVKKAREKQDTTTKPKRKEKRVYGVAREKAI